ncbi:ATP-dependent DNA helicase [Brevibacillus migulae]|uniref:ATP-dependent DNA helicase n=1 Tax=Brevibacillus migulae TaxID=1644114 RepID=UPI00106ED799|nr:ATP-dependent DNA helicase [Brevibacillus migulae]
MERYPFAYDPSQSFIQQVSDWIADVFYDILPDAGFEVRDEQIYMAFQLERAFQEKKTIFAEAGVGTGKTLVYLLYAICYARYTRKPAIIACANESLIEQLVKPEGDIAKLAKHLAVQIDARLAKSPTQYVCLNKLDESRANAEDPEVFDNIYVELPSFVHTTEALQSFYPYGDRSDYPHINDEQWEKIGWDSFQDCLSCDKQHRCGLSLTRDYYRKSADLIICSHDFYMEHVWTAEARKREGQLPLLPSHSAVVFDEGHLVEPAAQKALTYKFTHSVFEEIMTRLLQGEVRESFAILLEEAIVQSEALFASLDKQSQAVPGSDRKEIMFSESLLGEVKRLTDIIALIEDEMVVESGVYALDDYQLRIVNEHLDMIHWMLKLFQQKDQVISWLSEEAAGATLVVMPRMVKEVLRERVFSQKMPIVFSSATLSVDGSFHYMADSLGIEDYLSFTVASPYDYEQQMEMYAPEVKTENSFELKMKAASRLLERTRGRSLFLFPSKEEMKRFREHMSDNDSFAGMSFLFEGDQEISHLISAFQNEEESNLCAVSLWEGLDIPGPSLSSVIIWSLPFPPNDPVYASKRKRSSDPFAEVDLPYMLLRLRQGIGRLIRTREDRGIVTILSEELHQNEEIRQKVQEILPKGVEWKTELP